MGFYVVECRPAIYYPVNETEFYDDEQQIGEVFTVMSGRGIPRTNADGGTKTFRGDQYLAGKKGYGSQKNWIGAEEYEVGGNFGSHNRILKKVNHDGTVNYRYSETADYKVIHEIKRAK